VWADPKAIARVILILIGAIVMASYFSGCKPTERLVVHTEYVNQLKYDSIYLQKYDSIYVAVKGDTVRIEKYKTLFKDRLKIVRDTVLRTDSVIFTTPPVQVDPPAPEGGAREVNKWGFLDWVGLITLIAGAVLLVIKILTKPFLKYINSFNK
jgi:hypothetical protein